MITRDQAWQKVGELIANQNLVKHTLAVEAAMKEYAEHFNVPESERESWLVAALLHDTDYEKYPDKHPQVTLEWLKEQNAPEEIINAVASHGFNFDVEAKTLMAKTLRAVDELTGLIVAVALVRPSRKLADVDVAAVLKKWHEKGFARGANRQDIERGAAEIGVPLEKHIEIVLTAMQKISDQLGL